MAGSTAPAGAGGGAGVPCLVVEQPAHLAGTRWPLTRSAHIVGRFGDIRLSSPDVSKRHAELRQGTDGVWLNDLHSSNGVLHNGRRLEPGVPVRLRDGDRLRFGSLELTFHQPQAGGRRSTPDPAGADTITDVTHLHSYRNRRTGRADPAAAPPPPLPDPPPRHAPPPPISDDARSETTRYLAAATQLDPDFADLVVRQVVDEPYRALAPVFGADLGVVTRWALSARRRRLARDLTLLGVLLTLLATVALGALEHREELGSGDLGDWWQQYAVLAGMVLGVGWLVLAVDFWVAEHRVLRQKMKHGRFEPTQAPEALGGRARARLAAVAAAQRPAPWNVIVCSHYSPFAGSGYLLDQWDTPIDIRRGMFLPDGDGRRRAPQRFTNGELYEVLVTAARRMGLADLRVEERLFVDGQNVARDRNLLPDPLRPPVTHIPVPLMRDMPDGLSATRRSYVSIEVPAWSGQLVLTMYMRAVQVQGTLYLEWSAHALVPMRNEYYAVDHLPRRTAVGAALRALVSALFRVPSALLWSPRGVLRRVRAALAASAYRGRQRRTIRGKYVFDYGAEHSVRELACGEEFGHHFVDRDASRIMQTTEQHLMNTIGDFLESKGIDSESFLRFQQNVTNNYDQRDQSFRAGNINNHGNLAAGHGARAGGPAPKRGGRT
ncbi:FHA domain-containing protein [Streptomyces sp. CA-249302]|uniref:FHA domain-containing protein n=1 Tax=Streptomyces sp. CA-249302 TaxID=3240058 RepID=UPI003D8F4544